MCSCCFSCCRNRVELKEISTAPVYQSMGDPDRLPFDPHHLFKKDGARWIHRCYSEQEGDRIHSIITKVTEAALKQNRPDTTVYHQCAVGQRTHIITIPGEYVYRIPPKEEKKEQKPRSAFDFGPIYSSAPPCDYKIRSAGRSS